MYGMGYGGMGGVCYQRPVTPMAPVAACGWGVGCGVGVGVIAVAILILLALGVIC